MRALGPDFDDFVAAGSGDLLRTAYLLCGDRGHAEDLLQTALLRTARRWGTARANPTAYTRRVLVNLAKDRWRDRARRVGEAPLADTGDVADPDGEAAGERSELRQALLRAAAELPPRQRAVLVLRYFDELSVDETAAALGCSAGTVKSQTHHALNRLRQRLAEEELDERKESPC